MTFTVHTACHPNIQCTYSIQSSNHLLDLSILYLKQNLNCTNLPRIMNLRCPSNNPFSPVRTPNCDFNDIFLLELLPQMGALTPNFVMVFPFSFTPLQPIPSHSTSLLSLPPFFHASSLDYLVFFPVSVSFLL